MVNYILVLVAILLTVRCLKDLEGAFGFIIGTIKYISLRKKGVHFENEIGYVTKETYDKKGNIKEPIGFKAD